MWRNIQRLLKIKLTTPATSAEIASEHDLAMYRWAFKKCKSNDKLILIADHTHLPVFSSMNHLERLEYKMKEIKAEMETISDEEKRAHLSKQMAEKRAEIEFLKAKGRHRTGIPMKIDIHCYSV